MYPSGGSGDLYVSVEESDGSKQEFVVPFATLPVMVRENQLEYEITSGKYRPTMVESMKRRLPRPPRPTASPAA